MPKTAIIKVGARLIRRQAIRKVTANRSFRVGDWLVEPALGRISHEGHIVCLQPQVMELLVCFARHHRDVLSSDQLLSEVWGGRVVTKASIYSGLKQLREALGDDVNEPRYIKTIPKLGYRLVANVDFSDEQKTGAIAVNVDNTAKTGSRNWVVVAGAITVLVFVATTIFRSQLTNIPVEPTDHETPVPTIAVLPFTDMSTHQDQGWFCDGVTGEILNRLAQIPEMKVSGRMSSSAILESTSDLQNVGRTLGVDHLLKGSIRKDGEQIRLIAQLFNAASGKPVWSQKYDRKLSEVLSIRDDISNSIAQVLQLNQADNLHDNQYSSPAIYPDFSAFELYLQALDLIEKNTKNSLAGALSKLKKSLELDSEFADAHVSIAKAYLRLYNFNGYYKPQTEYEESRQLAEPHIRRALTIDPNNAAAYVMQSELSVAADPARIEALEKALSLNPNLYEAHLLKGVALNSYLVPWSEIMSHLDRAVEIEPLSIEAATILVLFLAWVPHRWEEAENIIARLELNEPESTDVKLMKASWLLNPLGSPSEAIPILEEILMLDPDHFWARSFLTKAWYMLGEFEQASKMPGGKIHWRYVLGPDREESLRLLKNIPESSTETDYGRRIVSSYAFVMMRDWQSAIDLLAGESGDLKEFTNTYVENFVLNESPAMSLATAFKALGDDDLYRKFADLEMKAVNIRTGNGRLHNIPYSRTTARLNALAGNNYETILELERLVTFGPIDPRELLHPAFDNLREDHRFLRLIKLQRERIDKERESLGLPPLGTVSPKTIAGVNAQMR